MRDADLERARGWIEQQIHCDWPEWLQHENPAIIERLLMNAASAVMAAVRAKGEDSIKRVCRHCNACVPVAWMEHLAYHVINDVGRTCDAFQLHEHAADVPEPPHG